MRYLILALCFICAFQSFADQYHYKNVLVGTKAIGLGGAFTSIADDMSAVFYNPAGLAKAKLSNSASLSTFSWESSTFENVFANQADFSRSSFSIIPSFLGTGKNTERWNWAFVFAVSDLSTERNFATEDVTTPQDVAQGVNQVQFGNIDLDNASYDLGFGGAINISNNWSFGASLIAKYKQFETVQGSGVDITINNPFVGSLKSGFTATRRIKDTNIIVTPQLGILYKSDTFNWGLKLSQDVSLNRNFYGSHQITVSSLTPLPPGVNGSSVGEVRGSKKQLFGTNVSMGISGYLSDLLFSFDVDRFSSVDMDSFIISDTQPPITRDLAEVTNYSLGLSYPISKNNLIRFGIFTDNSNGQLDLSLPSQRVELIDMLGYSVALNTNMFGFPLSIGGYYKYGEGDIRLADIRVVERIVGLPLYPQVNENDVSSMRRETFTLYISANF